MVIAALAGWAALASLDLATAPISTREIVEITDLSSVSASPDGRTAVFRAETALIERNGYELSWYAVPVDGSAPPRRIAGAGAGDWQDGTLLSQPPRWSADSTWIVYRASIDGQVQLWRTAVDGSRTEQLTRDAGNVIGFALDAESQTLTYSAGPAREAIERAEQAELDRGVRIDARVDPSRQLHRGARIDGRLASERLTGFWFAHAGLLADEPPRYRTLALASLALRDATAEEQTRLARAVQPFDTLGDRIIIARADSGDRRGAAYILAAGLRGELLIRRTAEAGNLIACAQPQCHEHAIVSAAWQQGADRVLFATSDGATNHALHLWDVASRSVRTLVSANGRLNGGRDDTHGCAVTADDAICVAASANDPPRLVRIALASGTITTLADPNRALGRSGQLVFEPLAWTDGAGRAFNGQLMLPRDMRGPVPLFVTYYVCDGYLRGGTGDEFPLRQLAQAGIAALCINRLPTVPGFGDQVEQYRLAQSGVTAAVDLLGRRGLIDRRRVGMGGFSLGAEVTMWIATHSDTLAAMSISSPLLSPTYYWFNAMAGRDVPDILKKVWDIGDPESDPRRWQEIAATRNIESIRAPLLMQMPEQEYRANMELASRLSRSATPVELWAFPYERHVKFQPRHKLAVYERNLDWFRYWLVGEIDPAAAKREQYRHWQAFARKPRGRDDVTRHGH